VLTLTRPVRTRDTVAAETPAAAATSVTVGGDGSSGIPSPVGAIPAASVSHRYPDVNYGFRSAVAFLW
jgi:hypothetical protein